MDGWWDEVEDEVRRQLDRHGEISPSELGRHLGISEDAAASLLAVLALDGTVRVTRVVSRTTSRIDEEEDGVH